MIDANVQEQYNHIQTTIPLETTNRKYTNVSTFKFGNYNNLQRPAHLDWFVPIHFDVFLVCIHFALVFIDFSLVS